MRPSLQPESRSTSALLRLLSHDLRTPLGPLALALSSIADEPSADEEVRALARFAEAQAGRMSRLIAAALDASGKPRGLQPSSFDLGALAEEIASALDPLAIPCSVSAGPAPVTADRSALRDAIVNVVEAACGEYPQAHLSVKPGADGAEIIVEGDATERFVEALERDAPADWRSAFACGARAVVLAHGGEIEATADRVLIRIKGGA